MFIYLVCLHECSSHSRLPYRLWAIHHMHAAVFSFCNFLISFLHSHLKVAFIIPVDHNLLSTQVTFLELSNVLATYPTWSLPLATYLQNTFSKQMPKHYLFKKFIPLLMWRCNANLVIRIGWLKFTIIYLDLEFRFEFRFEEDLIWFGMI